MPESGWEQSLRTIVAGILHKLLKLVCRARATPHVTASTHLPTATTGPRLTFLFEGTDT
jgi:hypothetical protein